MRDLTKARFTDAERQQLIENQRRLIVLNRRACLVLVGVGIAETPGTDSADSLRNCANRINRIVRGCERIIDAAARRKYDVIVVTLQDAPPDADCGDPDHKQDRDVREDEFEWPEHGELCALLDTEISHLADCLQGTDERLDRIAAVHRKIPYCIFAATETLARALDRQRDYLLRWATSRSPKIVVQYDRRWADDCS
jgi:hypothetical protein